MVPARKLEYHQPPVRTKKVTKVVRQKKRVRKCPETFLVCLFAVFAVALCLLYLGQQVHTMRLGLHYDYLEKRALEQENLNHRLQLELAQSQSLAVIERIARQDLNMIDPRKSEMIVLNTSPGEPLQPGQWNDTVEREDGLLARIADFINRWFPLGGVEAGQIGR